MGVARDAVTLEIRPGNATARPRGHPRLVSEASFPQKKIASHKPVAFAPRACSDFIAVPGAGHKSARLLRE
jgi:hypothetical protein